MKTKRGCRPYLGKNFSEEGDAQGTVPRLRKVFPDGAWAVANLQQPFFRTPESEPGFERMRGIAYVFTVIAMRRAHFFVG